MSMLPWILLEISKQQDFISYSELEDCVLGRYYHFAIFNVLIVFLLGTAFLSTMLDVFYEPAKLLQLLANSLPQGANFFLNYILFNSSTHAMELLQLGSQLFGHLCVTLPCVARTPRMLARYTSPWSFPYYYYYPNHILVLVITLTYSVIQPLVLVFALIYFTLALNTFRHQFAYCYIRRYESGGSRHYRRMARYTSDGLIIFQLTMVGLLYLKGVLAAATAILPLIVFTIWTKYKLSQLFGCRAKHPYVGRFGCSPLADVNTHKGMWSWIDDIWKFSYIKAWWVHGRYATQHPSTVLHERERETSGDTAKTDSARTSPASTLCADQEQAYLVRKKGGEEEDEDAEDGRNNRGNDELPSASDDLLLYDDDSRSPLETYEHPSFVRPLEKQLYLPRNPHLRRWSLKDCVKISLDDLSTAFGPHPSASRRHVEITVPSTSHIV
ncbi:hypothetical protein EC973_008975 [Apophysomyces ossiformis]|uniref:CSC1/OSCA1-like 7TM region domain-containing protein n=1 Tax=Apophysomyces ossiformis TaxID=679940 RepID=A0A8H7BML8_9FUNG|nr:hypothetical protein EC973_008975 [Apophysomyces ossiformis]